LTTLSTNYIYIYIVFTTKSFLKWISNFLLLQRAITKKNKKIKCLSLRSESITKFSDYKNDYYEDENYLLSSISIIFDFILLFDKVSRFTF